MVDSCLVIGDIVAFAMAKLMICLEPHTAVLAAVSDRIDRFGPVGHPMDQTGLGTMQQDITALLTGDFTAVIVFNHVTGKIPEVDTIFFKRVVPAIFMIRVQVVLGLA